MAKSRLRDALEFAALFFALYLLSNFALQKFFPDTFGNAAKQTGVFFTMQDDTVKGGHHPIAVLKNKTETPLSFALHCPSPPVSVAYMESSGFVERRSSDVAIDCKELGDVPAGGQVTIDLAPWKYSLFEDIGTYQLQLLVPVAEGEPTTLAVQFEHYEAGWVTQMFRAFISKPLLNLLVFIASVSPGYNLGIAIVLLTIFVKLLLYFPTQKGMESQKRLQAVQPKLEAAKQKYKNDPKKYQEETMRLWKEHKINPMGSCLPILIQFPVLIGLFFVIRDGSILELSTHLLYSFHQNLAWSFGTDFLGLDLKVPSRMIMPPLLVVLQFAQMKLSFAMAEKKKQEKEGKKKPAKTEGPDPQAMQKKMMTYGLPIMIGVFAFNFPAAVSLYWAVSTAFAIGQQVVVNKKTA